MNQKNLMIPGFLLGVVLFLIGVFFIPWSRVNWGKLEVTPSSTITVTGEAKGEQRSQIARFNAGASTANDDKDLAVAEVNEKIEALLTALDNFGIPQEDIKTQSLNVYQQQEAFNEEGREKTRPGQWQVSNTIEIKLRNVDQAGELAALLTSSGATNVYGPNFGVDETQEIEVNLLGEAIKNAQEKAEKAALESGRKLGKIISVSEGYRDQPESIMRLMDGAGGGAPLQPGTSTVYQAVTVTFELK